VVAIFEVSVDRPENIFLEQLRIKASRIIKENFFMINYILNLFTVFSLK
jgi:hypothetical protein